MFYLNSADLSQDHMILCQ